jgi:hypothetical protein
MYRSSLKVHVVQFAIAETSVFAMSGENAFPPTTWVPN